MSQYKTTSFSIEEHFNTFGTGGENFQIFTQMPQYKTTVPLITRLPKLGSSEPEKPENTLC